MESGWGRHDNQRKNTLDLKRAWKKFLRNQNEKEKTKKEKQKTKEKD